MVVVVVVVLPYPQEGQEGPEAEEQVVHRPLYPVLGTAVVVVVVVVEGQMHRCLVEARGVRMVVVPRFFVALMVLVAAAHCFSSVNLALVWKP